MDIECFVTGKAVDVENVFAVTSYEDLLILYMAFEKKTEKRKDTTDCIRIYKLEKEQLILHSQISDEHQNLSPEAYSLFDSRWAPKIRLFAFYSLHVQKPIVVLISDRDVMVRDFEGTLLAEDTLKSNYGSMNRNLLWKKQFLFDSMDGIFHLRAAKQSDFRHGQPTYPYKIDWKRDTICGLKTSIYNLSDKYLMSVVYPGMFIATQYKILIYDWDDISLTSQLSSLEFTKDGEPISWSSEIILSCHVIEEKIALITIQKSSYGESNDEKKVEIFNNKAQFESSFSLGEGSVLVWNNTILHIDNEKPRVNTVTIWNLHGEIVDTYVLDIPAFYVWNRYLVVFNDQIEVYRGLY